MSLVSKIALATAAAGMSVAPVAAQAAPAQIERGSAKAEGNELAGGGTFVAIIAAIAVILGIIVVSNEDDEPHSP